MYKRILKAAIKTGSSQEDAEDIAQEVLCSWIAYERKYGKRPSQTVDHAIIDAKRRMFGGDRTVRGNLRQASRFGAASGKRGVLVGEGDIEEIPVRSSATSEIYKYDLSRLLKGLELIDRVIFKLVYEEEWLLREIAALLDIHESRVSQRLKVTREYLMHYLKD